MYVNLININFSPIKLGTAAEYDGFVKIKMSNGFDVNGYTHKQAHDPLWMTTPPSQNFKDCEVIIHTWLGLIFSSIFRIPKTNNFNLYHNLRRPKEVRLTLGFTNFIMRTEFVMYDPRNPDTFEFDRIFIAIPETKDIYCAYLEIENANNPTLVEHHGTAHVNK